MSSGEAELLAKILAAPDDDAPRLVLADLLNAKGDPRGEFITLQCRLAASKDDEARRKIRVAENKLLAAHGLEWSKALLAAAPPSTPLRANKIVYHRGFLEEAALPLGALDELEKYFEAAPLLRRLRFDAPPTGPAPIPPPTMEGQLKSPRLKGVRALDLRVMAGGDAAAISIAESPNLTGLRELKPLILGSGDFTPNGLEAIAKSKTLTSLETLKFDGSQLGPKAIAVFLNALKLPKLSSLGLSATGLGDEGAKTIATSKASTQFKSLELQDNKITEQGSRAIADSAQLGGLERLLLSDAWLWKKANLEYLAGSTALANTKIYVKGTLISGKAKKAATEPEPPRKKTKTKPESNAKKPKK